MGEQRRRGGRGRSGRGGRIPRRGEGGAQNTAHDESFVSFPLEIAGPLRVETSLSVAAVEETLRRVYGEERELAAALKALEAQGGDPVLSDLRVQVERHRDVLAQLARDLGSDAIQAGNGEAAGEAVSLRDQVARQRLAHLGWLTLERIGHASGDRRIDRAVKPVLREKRRHAEVLEGCALAHATRGLFPEPEA